MLKEEHGRGAGTIRGQWSNFKKIEWERKNRRVFFFFSNVYAKCLFSLPSTVQFLSKGAWEWLKISVKFSSPLSCIRLGKEELTSPRNLHSAIYAALVTSLRKGKKQGGVCEAPNFLLLPRAISTPLRSSRESPVLCRAALQAPALHPCLCLLGVSQSWTRAFKAIESLFVSPELRSEHQVRWLQSVVEMLGTRLHS